MLYCFTNRRRAKDSIMLIKDSYGTDGVTVFVRESLIYVDVDAEHMAGTLGKAITTIMHFAEQSEKQIEDVLMLDQITELYQGDGLSRFRV